MHIFPDMGVFSIPIGYIIVYKVIVSSSADVKEVYRELIH